MEMEAAESNLEFAPVESEGKEPVLRFLITEDKINELANQYFPLKIAGVEDKYGYEVVHAARIVMRDIRLETERDRKARNEKAQAWIKKWNAEAKRLTGLMAPIEDHLDREESAYKAEQDRSKAEKQKAADEQLQKRISALQAVGAPFQVSELVQMSDTAFDFLLATATETWNAKEAARIDMEAKAKAFEEAQAREAAAKAEQARIEKERADQAEAARVEKVRQEQATEAARLAAVKSEQDKQAAALRALQDKLDADRRTIEQAQRDEQVRKDAEAKAKADAEKKAAEDTARKEREAARPDAEKLEGFAYFLEGKSPPDMETEAGLAASKKIKAALVRFTIFIRAEAEGLKK